MSIPLHLMPIKVNVLFSKVNVLFSSCVQEQFTFDRLFQLQVNELIIPVAGRIWAILLVKLSMITSVLLLGASSSLARLIMF